MRLRIFSALFLSVFLILGAALVKAREAKTLPNQIVSVENGPTNLPESYIPTEESDLSLGIPSTIEEKLTTTDLVGRQMILDYVNLAASGKATDETVTNLANKYTESIGGLSQSRKISYLNIETTPNSKQSFFDYENELTDINLSFEKQLSKLSSASASTMEDSAMYSAASVISSAYDIASSRLMKLKVPVSLVQAHVKLVNAYLGSAESMRSMSLGDSDPAVAFAGAVSVSSALESAETALIEIEGIMNRYDL